MDGICTLANDVIYDQLVALLNSIESILGADFPVCIYPYDDRVELINKHIAKRPNVILFEDQQIIEKWDNFVKKSGIVTQLHAQNGQNQAVKAIIGLEHIAVIALLMDLLTALSIWMEILSYRVL